MTRTIRPCPASPKKGHAHAHTTPHTMAEGTPTPAHCRSHAHAQKRAHSPASPRSKRSNTSPDLVLCSPYDGLCDHSHILHAHLCTRLGVLYPRTAEEVREFAATRLLSRDTPHGHEGVWAPLRFEDGPSLVAGAMDARVHEMFGVAYRSYALLVDECPDHEHKI